MLQPLPASGEQWTATVQTSGRGATTVAGVAETDGAMSGERWMASEQAANQRPMVAVTSGGIGGLR